MVSIDGNWDFESFTLFSTVSESELSVYEYMGESALTSLIPRLLLDILIVDEKSKV